MANLKFKEISWTKELPTLMYVEFELNGKVLKWYPRWDDLSSIVESAWSTENQFNHGKQMDYLSFVSISLLMRFLLINNGAPHEIFTQLNKIVDEAKKILRSK